MWEVPNVGAVSRDEVVEMFGLIKSYLQRLVNQANKGELPLVWLTLLWLLVEESDKVHRAANAPALSPTQLQGVREKFGLSLVDMTHLTGYTRTSIGHWESVSCSFSAKRNYQIFCRLLNDEPQTTFSAVFRYADQIVDSDQRRFASLRDRLTAQGLLRV
jgi:DNA-binding XRE family transcriptional regulator